MVFLGRDFYEREEPELLLAVRRQAARFGWSELVTVVGDIDDAVAFGRGHAPGGEGGRPTGARRRRPPERG